MVEVLLGDEVLATGTYHLVIDHQPAGTGGGEWSGRTTARGTMRVEGGAAHRAMGAAEVRLRLDHAVDLLVEVHLYVPGAGFAAFTSTEEDGLNRLLHLSSHQGST